jgi:hypothetical protein
MLVWLPAAMERGRASPGVQAAVSQGVQGFSTPGLQRQDEAPEATPVSGGGRWERRRRPAPDPEIDPAAGWPASCAALALAPGAAR